MKTTIIQYDTAIIGTGAAGLTAAIHLAGRAPDMNILIGTKSELDQSSSSFAQGGIAVPWDVPFDNEEIHIHDTLKAGGFKNDLVAVRTIICDARPRIAELAKWGMPFDRKANGQLRLHREGGHSHKRVAHHGDQTGKALIQILLDRLMTLPNVTVMDRLFATDLRIDDGGNCTGFNAIKDGIAWQVEAQNTILATGGIGQLYETTTNPAVATGDGIAMAYRAGAGIRHMAFIQFHPTAWYDPEKNPNELVTEAIRGEGAILRNHEGVAFMKDRHALADLAPRDVVARNIFLEMKKFNQPHVWLDTSKVSRKKLEKQYPKLWSNLQQYRLNHKQSWIPVAPAAHYLCGGIHTDMDGKTSIPHFYALGESAHTGFHGANRLASNSLLEGVVMAHRCIQDILRTPVHTRAADQEHQPLKVTGDTHAKKSPAHSETHGPLPVSGAGRGSTPRKSLTKSVHSIRGLMQQHANVLRNEEGLAKALEKLNAMGPFPRHSQQECELANLHTVARLILEDSIRQNENTGVFFKEMEAEVS